MPFAAKHWPVFALCSCLFAQPPAISQNGVANAATQIPSALVNAAIARGSRFTVRGVRLSNARVTLRPLQPGAKPVSAIVVSASPSRVEAIVPRVAGLGPANLFVASPGGESKPFPVNIIAAQPGLFSTGEIGWGQADAVQPGGANSLSHSARPGDPVRLRVTGFAPSAQIRVFVGEKFATAQLTPERAGIGQLRFRIPAASPHGCTVPVYAVQTGAPRSNVVTLAIESKGGPCRLSDGTSAGDAFRIGTLSLLRAELRNEPEHPGTTVDESEDVFFDRQKPRQPLAPLVMPPPLGTCTAYASSADSDAPDFTSFEQLIAGNLAGSGLNAGAELTVAGPRGSRTIPAAKASPGLYWARLGLEEAGAPRHLPLFFAPGDYRFSIPGGPGIPALSRSMEFPSPAIWRNRDQLLTIDRSAGMTFEWTGAAPGTWVALIAANTDRLSTAAGTAFCAAAPDAGRFTIPPEMLNYVPSTPDEMGRLRSVAVLVTLRVKQGTPPPIPGLDLLWLVAAHVDAQRVIYR